MQNRFQVAIALLISAVAPGSGVYAPEAPTRQGIVANHYVISEVQAKLYYFEQRNFLAEHSRQSQYHPLECHHRRRISRWASENTLVQVVVAGQPESFAKGLAVQHTAKTPTQTLLDRLSNVGVMNTNGRYYAGFWLYETGCEPVELTVKLIGEGSGQTVTKTIPFECGE